ncbi:MAG: cell division protein SepF [Candidatus Bathyarchaeales archaeon]
MPSIGLFRKPKKEGEEKAEMPPQEDKESANKTYLKAMPLRELSDLEAIKNEVKSGNVLILRITPLASKSIEDVKRAVNELYEFAESIGGDIARLGEERVVICPQNIKIWREKPQVSKETLPTAA